MWIEIAQFITAGAVIIVGGIGLARSADAIARVTGLGQALAGSLLLASATSLPDFVVGVNAARSGWADMIVGDLLGAALINLLILAILDLSYVSKGRMLSRMGAAHALSGAMVISLMALVGLSNFLPETVNVTFGGISIGLWAVVATYVMGLRLVYFDQVFAAARIERAVEDGEPIGEVAGDGRRDGLARPVIVYLLSALAIILAAPVLAGSANTIATRTGLGNTFFGTAFVPLCTTLPELAVGITAIRMRAFPLVVGNAFGSIAFNLALLAPIDFFFAGSLMAAASKTHLITCFAAIVIMAVAIMGQLYHAERRRPFLEPDALLIIALTFGAFALIYFAG